MGQRADTNKINALLGIVADSIEGDTTARLCFIAMIYNIYSFLGIGHTEVVEHNTIDASVIQNLLQLVERAYLNLNLSLSPFSSRYL